MITLPTPKSRRDPHRSPWATPEMGIAAVATLLPACALLTSRGVVVVMVLGVLISLWRLGTEGRLAEILRGHCAFLLMLFILWAGTTLFWTLDPTVAGAKLATVAGILLGALVLITAARSATHSGLVLIENALVGGFIIGAGILTVDVLADQIVAGTARRLFSPDSAPLAPAALNQGACVLAVLVWPVAITVWRRGHAILTAVLVVGTGVLVAATPSSSAGFAVIVGALGGGLVYWGGARATRSLGWGIAGLTLLAPAIPLTIARPHILVPFLPETALPELHRLHLWEFVAENIVQRPWGGWGFFASRSMPGGSTELIPGVPLMALHPHNGALQAWLELGVPGALLLAGSLYFLLTRAGAAGSGRATAAATTATILAALSIGSLSYGLWQSWWLTTLGIVSCIATVLHAYGAGHKS